MSIDLEFSGSDTGSLTITGGSSVMSGSTTTSFTGNSNSNITRKGTQIGEEPKKSGNRQLKSRFSKFFSKCLSQIKQRWFMLKLDYWLANREKWKKNQYKKYCSKGFHSLYPTGLSVTYKKSVWKVEYLECQICGKFKWFATIKDKRKYLKMTSNKRSRR